MAQVVAESPQDVGGGTLGAQLASKIEEEIRREGWREGHLIGSESELTAKFEVGVAAVPGSSFYRHPELGRSLIRFTFCKREETLREAARRLARLPALRSA